MAASPSSPDASSGVSREGRGSPFCAPRSSCTKRQNSRQSRRPSAPRSAADQAVWKTAPCRAGRAGREAAGCHQGAAQQAAVHGRALRHALQTHSVPAVVTEVHKAKEQRPPTSMCNLAKYSMA